MSKCRKLCVENLESRRVLAASLGWDGPSLESAQLSYYIGNSPDSLTQSEVDAAIESALKVWSEVADIEFTRTSRSGQLDSLDFTFANLDGSGNTLAQAYFPDDVNPARIAGDVQFDSAETWEVGNALGSAAFDLVAVAVHEIGHALGLDHNNDAGSVLLPTISPNTEFVGLSQHDVEAIQELYAPAAASTSAILPNTAEPTATHESTIPEDRTSPQNETPWNRFRWHLGFMTVLNRGGFGSIGAVTTITHNIISPTDVNADQLTSPIDALLVINALNDSTGFEHMVHMCDINDDGALSPVDALLVINQLNTPEAEAADDSGGSPTGNVPRISDDPNDALDGSDTVDDSDTVDHSIDDRSDSSLDENSVGYTETEVELSSEESVHDEQHEHVGISGHLVSAFGLGLGGRLDGLRQAAIDSLFANFDADENQALTEEEVPAFVWDYLTNENVDTNSDNSVTLEELNAAAEAKKLERFDALDEDGDGLLTESELSAKQWERIRDADTNADGGVSFDELETFMSLTKFERLDANGDAEITANEVSERAWERLCRYDDNGDGAITSDELPSRPDATERVSHFAKSVRRVIGLIAHFR